MRIRKAGIQDKSEDEVRRLKGELLACHKSYLSQVHIVDELKRTLREMADAASERARLVDMLRQELHGQPPRVQEMVGIVEMIQAVRRGAKSQNVGLP
jgi:hypothetical protein